MARCRYCGHDASRQSDEDCPAKPRTGNQLRLNNGYLPELVEAARRYERAHLFNAGAGKGHSTPEEMAAWAEMRRILARIEGGE